MTDERVTVDGYTPIHRKCLFWREQIEDEDVYDSRLSEQDRRVSCTCFVEGDRWAYTVATVPPDCPKARKCRYYIYNA